MLPPVRASLNSFADYQPQPQQPMLRQRIDVSNTLANAGTVASRPSPGGRLDVLSLSAQLQLAQGVSIFAETIGKLIKAPRREGEALLDYTKRLLETVKAMTPAERGALERAMNQLVKGITLRLLIEILNDPTGPDAARFAMRLETAQLLDRDLAAKAVVSSYRQNAGADQTGNPLLPRPTATPAPAAPHGGNVASQGPPAQEGHVQVAVHGEEAGVLTAADASGNDKATAKTRAGAEVELVAPSDEAVVQGSPPVERGNGPSSNVSAEAETPALPSAIPTDIDVELQAVSSAEPETLREDSQEEVSEPSSATSDDTSESSAYAHRPEGSDPDITEPLRTGRRMSAPVFYDGPALARLSQRSSDPVRSPALDRMTAAAINEWLAETLVDKAADGLLPPPAVEEALPEQRALKELLDNESLTRPPLPTNAQAAEAAQKSVLHAASEPENQPATTRAASMAAGTIGQAAGSQDLAEQLVLPMPMPHILRDGIPLPYVAYPPEERERDPEERKMRAISATDEDGEQQHSANEQAFHGEAQDHNSEDEPSEDVSGESDGEPAPSSPANDLYWRMAGWA